MWFTTHLQRCFTLVSGDVQELWFSPGSSYDENILSYLLSWHDPIHGISLLAMLFLQTTKECGFLFCGSEQGENVPRAFAKYPTEQCWLFPSGENIEWCGWECGRSGWNCMSILAWNNLVLILGIGREVFFLCGSGPLVRNLSCTFSFLVLGVDYILTSWLEEDMFISSIAWSWSWRQVFHLQLHI